MTPRALTLPDRRTLDGERLERFRPYLTVLARTHMGPELRERAEPSDVVQLTLLQALRALPEFRGDGDAALAAWLRKILARNLAHASRDLRRKKRSAEVETTIDGKLARSSAAIEGWLAAKDTSPSQQVARTEQLLAVAAAVERLPQAQRDAVVLHYWQELPLAEVAAALDRSTGAVALLLHRALKTLRQEVGR